jgi:hypothetical protein
MTPLSNSLMCTALGMVLLTIVSRRDISLSCRCLARPCLVRVHEPYEANAGTNIEQMPGWLSSGEYRIGDYWRMELSLDLFILQASLPLTVFVLALTEQGEQVLE